MLERFVVTCTVLMSSVSACGLFSRTDHQAGHREGARVLVEIESHNWNDITVYLVTSGLPQRLGMVTALGNADFDFPSQRLNTGAGIRLRALPVAGRPFTTETILVQPGQVITWTIENDLDASSITVY